MTAVNHSQRAIGYSLFKHGITSNLLYWVYLALLSILLMAIAYTITTPYGAGVGTDGIIYLSNAENLAKGKGLVDYSNQPLLRWPPLYPLLLLLVSQTAQIGSYSAGWILNILLYGTTVWLGGILLHEYFPNEPLWAYLGSLVIATSSSLLSLAITINTDLLFIVLAWGFLIAANRYANTTSPWSMLAMTLLAALAAFTRLPGVTLVASGVALILIVHRKNMAMGLVLALLFSFLSLLPLASWLIIHNYIGHHVLLGSYFLRSDFPLKNLTNSLAKIVHWFVSYNPVVSTAAALILGTLALVIVFTSKGQNWRRLGSKLVHPSILPSLFFTAIYMLFLVLTANPLDTSYPDYDRYQIVILPAVLLIIFAVPQELFLARSHLEGARRSKINVPLVLISVLFITWLVYPILKTSKYISVVRQEGDTRYNLYNTPIMRQSKIVQVIREIHYRPGATIYSNLPAAVWFYTFREAHASPRGYVGEDIVVKELLKQYTDWPGAHPGYLVWFLPNEINHALKPKDLAKIADLSSIYRGRDGEVYRVENRTQ